MGMACALWGAGSAQAQSETSLALPALPVASVVAAAASIGNAQEAVAVPLFLSAGGMSLVVAGVEASAKGVKSVLKNTADGVSAVVESSAIGAGVILSTAGKVLAFIPNEIGKALLHSERL